MRTHTLSTQNVLLTLYDIHLTLLILFFFPAVSHFLPKFHIWPDREPKRTRGIVPSIKPHPHKHIISVSAPPPLSARQMRQWDNYGAQRHVNES